MANHLHGRAIAQNKGGASRPRAPGNLAKAAPWLARLALAAAVLVLLMIARKFILDPVASAAVSQTHLDAPIAITNMRASFGAFPLGCALVALSCLTSPRLHLGGLATMASVIGSALVVRVAGILIDGTFAQSRTVLTAEAILLTLTVLAIFAELARRSTIQSAAGAARA
jgi:hypothetical protein